MVMQGSITVCLCVHPPFFTGRICGVTDPALQYRRGVEYRRERVTIKGRWIHEPFAVLTDKK